MDEVFATQHEENFIDGDTTKTSEGSPIRKWEVERDMKLKEKAIENEAKNEELRQEASKFKDAFFSARNEVHAKRAKENKQKEEALIKDFEEEPDNVWKAVIKHVDKKNYEEEGPRDKSRYQKLLLELSNN